MQAQDRIHIEGLYSKLRSQSRLHFACNDAGQSADVKFTSFLQVAKLRQRLFVSQIFHGIFCPFRLGFFFIKRFFT